MSEVVQKFGDTRPVAWKTNYSLLNSTVVLKVIGPGGTVDTTGDVTITDAWGGIVEWDHGGTLAIGSYSVELWITREGETIKAPSSGTAALIITPSLT